MDKLLTTAVLVLLTLLALAASVLALRRLRRDRGEARFQHGLVWVITVGCGLLFLFQEVVVHGSWKPLEAHVDGLLLIAALLGVTLLYLQRRPRLEALSAFALPLLTLLLLWAICASRWTYWEFDSVPTSSPRGAPRHPLIFSLWLNIHLACVYLGMLFSVVAAMAGAMYLYVQRKLRGHADPRSMGRLASLETLETLIIRTATLGFAFLTLGLVAGLVRTDPHQLREGGWHEPKILLAAAAWMVYALVMNVRFTPNFRGARAAWLSIAGLVLLLATFAVATALPTKHAAPTGSVPPSPRLLFNCTLQETP